MTFSVLKAFNKNFAQKREQIAKEVREILVLNPSFSSAEAIKLARATIANAVISEISLQLPYPSSEINKALKKLKQRFTKHQNKYLKPEKEACKWAASKGFRNTTYAGDLADVVKDIKSNPDLVPVFASPEIYKFVYDTPSKDHKLINKLDLETQKSIVALRMGISALSELPYINFQGIDDVLELRERLNIELYEFKEKMIYLSSNIDLFESNVEMEIKQIIIKELYPAINELKRKIDEAKRFPKWNTIGAATSTGGLCLTAAMGFPMEAIIPAAITAISSLTALGYDYDQLSQKTKDMQYSSKFHGLSLFLKMRSRNK